MANQTSPRVFISYSHDSREHEDRVRALADRLRQDGVDAIVDQYNEAPPEGWPLWMDREIQRADFVALVCTETYLRRVEGREEPGKGRGVLWEYKLVYNHLYADDAAVQRYIPILLEGGAPSSIPWPVRGFSYFKVHDAAGYEDFIRHVTGQLRHEKPELGKLESLSAMAPRSYPASLEVRTERDSPTSLDRRNRLQMLKRVHLDWIEGVLNRSLYKVARIDLGLEASPDAVEQPLNAIVQVPEGPPAPVPAGTSILQVFDDHGGALLILGAPGTGKTTLLLELAQGLLARAGQDESYPIPVIFNLSSWALRRQSLTRWLVAELNERSDVPRRVAQRWVETEQVLPLLDGLDEVAEEHRQACVEAINAFRRDHGLLPIAVCSRSADYEALAAKLRLRTAVVVQALTRPQVEGYLERVGEPLRALRVALENDPSLWELLETPLMLWVAMLAYQDAPVDFSGPATLEHRHRRLFAGFVDAMFKRRSATVGYTPQQTARWLSWLARALDRKNQTIFYLEGLRAEWFANRAEKWLSRALAIAACGLAGGPVLGLIYGVILALAVLFLKVSHVTIHSGPAHWLMLLKVTTVSGIYWARTYWLSIALSMGTVGAFLELRPVEQVHFALAGMSSRLGRAARVGLVLGLGAGLAVCSVFALTFRGSPIMDMKDPRVLFMLALGVPRALVWPLSVLSAALIAALIVGPFAGLITLLSSEVVESRRSPNQGTERSIRTAIVAVALSGLIGLGVGWFFRPGSGENPSTGLILGLAGGFTGGLIVGLIAGGLFSLMHFSLRLTLWLKGLAPLRYASFLDWSAERLFLRRLGGGYIFAHRMLREYFVSLAESQPPDPDALKAPK